jgi:site-specific recombinase XerD
MHERVAPATVAKHYRSLQQLFRWLASRRRAARHGHAGGRVGDALRRYLRERARNPAASRTDAVWIGRKGTMTDSGVRQMLERRCNDSGLDPTHPHQFRHTMAHRWLAVGGQETGLRSRV